MSHPLNGKVAIVTGGSRGIGAAITRRLARDGADVAFSYASNTARAEEIAAAISAAGVRALPIQADQADPVAVAKFVRTVHAHFGRLNILVNSAGITVGGRIDDLSADVAAIQHMLSVNLHGVVATSPSYRSTRSIQSRRVWSPVSHGPAVTSPAYPPWPASTSARCCRFSARVHPELIASPAARVTTGWYIGQHAMMLIKLPASLRFRDPRARSGEPSSTSA